MANLGTVVQTGFLQKMPVVVPATYGVSMAGLSIKLRTVAPLVAGIHTALGSNDFVFTRADSGATVKDFEGGIREVDPGGATAEGDHVPRLEGARYVKNQVIHTTILEENGWIVTSGAHPPLSIVSGLPDALGGNTAVRYERSNSNDIFQFAHPTISFVGNITNSLYVKFPAATVNEPGFIVEVLGGSNAPTDWVDVTSDIIADTWQRISVAAGASIVTSYSLSLKFNATDPWKSGLYVEVCYPQIELVTGQANQNPSDFVEDYAYYTYENGNTISSNIVTEARGADIADATLEGLLVEKTATNIATYSETFSNAAWVASSITKSTEAFQTPVGGATSHVMTASGANGTLIQTITATVSDRDFSIWLARKTGTGTINITVDGGVTWTPVTLTSAYQRFDVSKASVANPAIGIQIVTSGDAVYIFGGQCETGLYKTSYIPNLATGTTTRAVETSSMPVASNLPANDFTIYAEVSNVTAAALCVICSAANAADTGSSLVFYFNGGELIGFKDVTGAHSVTTSGAGITEGGSYKVIYRHSSTEGIALFIDTLPAKTVSGTPDTNDILYGTSVFVGCTKIGQQTRINVKYFRIYHRPLSDAECLELVS